MGREETAAAVKITKLNATNFLSLKGVDLDLDGAGLTLVEGENQDDESAQSNGSGKSALVDALVWCLFGTTLRGYESDEVVHRRAGKDCLVQVWLEGPQGAEYLVQRARKHATLKNTLRVVSLSAGADLSKPDTKETQLVVEQLLGCTLKTFLTSVVFGQDRAYRFSSLTDKEQKEILDEVLGVGRFADACTEARTEQRERADEAETHRRDLQRAEDDLEREQTNVAEMRAKDDKFQADKEYAVKTERAKLREAEAALAKLGEVDVDAAKKKVEKARAKLETAQKSLADDLDLHAETKRGVKTITEKLALLSKQRREVAGLSGSCPTCLQDVDKKHHKRVLGELDRQIKDADASLKSAERLVETENAALERSRLAAEAAVAAVKLAEKERDAAVRADADVRVAREEVKRRKEKLKEVEARENPYEPLVQKAEKRVAKLTIEVEQLKLKVDVEMAKLKQATFWVDAFGARGLRSLLLDGSLPLLNEEAARVSEAITGGAITVEFSATSDLKSGKTVDRFEVRVDNKHGAASYRGNSAGERAKVDLCVGLALQKLVASRATASFNVAFMDEVFDHLDAAAHERVVDVLAQLDKDSVFVVSHNEDLKAWFPNSIRVVKKGGYSTLESE